VKRYRIDFTVREVGVPPEEAQGVVFGDEVSVDSIYSFFNRCRDAVTTLFNNRVVDAPTGEDPSKVARAVGAAAKAGPTGIAGHVHNVGLINDLEAELAIARASRRR
jgi:hypothetical protein